MPGRFVLYFNQKRLQEYRLNQKITTIGRHPDNDIVIDNLSISGFHAKIITIINASFIEDLNSTNGTEVNDKPIKKWSLKDGDMVTLGKYQLKFINENDIEKSESNIAKTICISPNQVLSEPPSHEPIHQDQYSNNDTSDRTELTKTAKPDKSPHKKSNKKLTTPESKQNVQHALSTKQASNQTPAAVRLLEILEGKNKGKTINLIKNVTYIGKKGIGIAAITRKSGNIYIFDKKDSHISEKFTIKVNDYQIDNKPFLLHNDDIVEINGIKMLVKQVS